MRQSFPLDSVSLDRSVPVPLPPQPAGHLAFHPGMPDADSFPFNTWSRLLARRAKLARHDLFGSYYVNGYPPLQRAIAGYLKVARGVRCRPEQIIITTGAQAALDLLA